MIKKTVLLLSVLVVFVSCSKNMGYGVILWGEEGFEYENGAVVPLLSESKLNSAYYIPGKEKSSQLLVPTWRVEYFETREEAEAYAAEYAPYTGLFVYSEKEGIPPVRERQGTGTSNKIVFKFKAHEPGKVLSRSAEKEIISQMEGYWYHVLMESKIPLGDGKFKSVGIKGYCFGYYLKEVDKNNLEQVDEEASKPGASDLVIKRIMSNIWRPLYFLDMIRENRVDLEKFNPRLGLFPDPENKRILIVTDKHRYTSEYEEIIAVRGDLFSFPNSQLRIETIGSERLTATYYVKNRQISTVFTLISEDIDKLIERETTRRTRILEDFTSRGTKLSSSAYGSITLDEGGSFLWTGMAKLQPQVIPRGVSGAGHISFPYFLPPGLAKSYDGVVSFRFDDLLAEKGINFLYQLSADGVKLFFLENDAIEDTLVKSDTGPGQVVLYFNYKE